MLSDLSLEPLSTRITSKSLKVWTESESRQSVIYLSPLKFAMITVMAGFGINSLKYLNVLSYKRIQWY
jgi:hypothetical protein